MVISMVVSGIFNRDFVEIQWWFSRNHGYVLLMIRHAQFYDRERTRGLIGLGSKMLGSIGIYGVPKSQEESDANNPPVAVKPFSSFER